MAFVSMSWHAESTIAPSSLTVLRNRSVSQQDTFPADVPLDQTDEMIIRLAQKTWTASRKETRIPRTVVLKLKTREFRIITRSPEMLAGGGRLLCRSGEVLVGTGDCRGRTALLRRAPCLGTRQGPAGFQQHGASGPQEHHGGLVFNLAVWQCLLELLDALVSDLGIEEF